MRELAVRIGADPRLDVSLSIEEIRRRLSTERIGFQTYLFGAVTSTNTVLRRLAQTGGADGTAVLAEEQTAGRGRLGKTWYSPAGMNVYVSVLFRPTITVAAMPVFAMIASLAVTDAAWAEGVPAAIKWPNDVVVGRRKLAGTLVEYASGGDLVEYAILGVGVNVNIDRAGLVTGLGEEAVHATSLRESAGRPIDRNAFIAAFLNLLEKWDDEYRAHGAASVLAAWRERDALAGHLVHVSEADADFDARVLGVAPDGRLVVEDERGGRRELTSAELALVS
jgi:BirA family biotin operon repressor/biotin-[acetyl-CoA-carboxylase] ligase